MIIRRVDEGRVLAIAQESHADVAAQFAAHWGGGKFARLEPYGSMLFGVTYHDSGHREMEADLPIDPSTGLPYNFRGAPPEVRNREADTLNARWIGQRDPYAGLLVSMHHTGLRKRRYDTVSLRRDGGSEPPATAEKPLSMDDAFEDLQGWQRETAEQLRLETPAARQALWHNYKMLQVFDLLSLYVCCDGYDGERMLPYTLSGVPLHRGSDESLDIAIVPQDGSALRFAPYPFEAAPLTISAQARQLTVHAGEPATVAKEEYYRAPRRMLTWDIAA